MQTTCILREKPSKTLITWGVMYIFEYFELQENKLFQLHLLEILQNTNL